LHVIGQAGLIIINLNPDSVSNNAFILVLKVKTGEDLKPDTPLPEGTQPLSTWTLGLRDYAAWLSEGCSQFSNRGDFEWENVKPIT
jgi:hypothetical protein